MFCYQNANNVTQNMAAIGDCTDDLWDQSSYYHHQFPPFNQITPHDGYFTPEYYFYQDKINPNLSHKVSEYETSYDISQAAISMVYDENYPIPVPDSYNLPGHANHVLQCPPRSHEAECPPKAKKPRTHISLMPTSGGNYKAIIKRSKRKRTTFTTEQIAALENYFSRRPYITREQRQVLADELQLSDKSVKIWFQNRRLKGKRSPERSDVAEGVVPNTSSGERMTSDSGIADTVEYDITKKSDNHGLVTLDDGVIVDVVDVIDKFLSNDDQVSSVESNESQSPIYEPISPASVSDSCTDDNYSLPWEPSEPNESLQRLFDIQSIFSL